MLQLAGRIARQQCWPLTTHVAESEEEFEMFMYRNGPLFDWLKAQRDMTDCGHGSPVSFLEKAGYLKRNLLAAHVNYLWRDDARILARRHVSVVHCPRSHDYFRHLRFSLSELHAAGVNICLGTDSLVSTRKISGRPVELNMFAEMQALAVAHPEIAPATMNRMAGAVSGPRHSTDSRCCTVSTAYTAMAARRATSRSVVGNGPTCQRIT